MTTRFKYSGAAPGADTNTYAIFSTVTAFPFACAAQQAGDKRLRITFDHIYTGTVNLYRSVNRGVTWTQVMTREHYAPAAAGCSVFDVPIEAFADFKVEWVNGGTAQDPWDVDIALCDQRDPADLFSTYDGAALALMPYSQVGADFYTLDPATGKVGRWEDKVAAGAGIRAITPLHAFAQGASAAVQCAAPTRANLLGSRPAAVFNNDAWYQSNSPASSWRQHGGTGFEMFVALDRKSVSGTQYIHATTSAGTSANGMQLFQIDAGAGHYHRIGNATVLISDRIMGVYAVGATYMNVDYVEGASPEVNARDKAVLSSSGDTTAAPVTGVDPSYAMTLGGTGAGTAKMTASWGESVFFDRVLSAAGRAQMQWWLANKFNIT